jgi:hypothetical protein
MVKRLLPNRIQKKTTIFVVLAIAALGAVASFTSLPLQEAIAQPASVDERVCPSGTQLERGQCVREKTLLCLGADQEQRELIDETGEVVGVGCFVGEEFFGLAQLGCPQGTQETSSGKCSAGRPSPQR